MEVLGEEVVSKTPSYRGLLHHTSKLEALLERDRALVESTREEIFKLSQIQENFRGELQVGSCSAEK